MFGFRVDHGQAGSNQVRRPIAPKSRASPSTCLCSRITGDVVLDRSHLDGYRVYQVLSWACPASLNRSADRCRAGGLGPDQPGAH